MIHIAICDDEKDFASYLQEQLKRYSEENGIEIKTSIFYDGLELIEKFDTTIDLIFLDIQMDMVNGLKAAEHIRKKDAKVEIIFLTTMAQYAVAGYTYKATNFIIKPIKYVRLKTEMDLFVERHNREESPYLVISNDTGKYRITLNTLRYVETYNRHLLFHTEKENIVSYKSMKDAEQELEDKGFARCHTSYIVNLFYVKGVKKLEIELITGEVIPISQPKRKEFMTKLTNYWGEML